MPVPAADRIWPDLFPFRARRRLTGLRLAATGRSWSAGQGLLAEGPIAAIPLAHTGRPAAETTWPPSRPPGRCRRGTAR